MAGRRAVSDVVPAAAKGEPVVAFALPLCRMLDYSPEDLEQMTFEQVTHPDDLDLDLAFVSQLVSGEIETYGLEKRCVRRDGTLLWGRLAVSVVRDDDGAPLYFVTQIEDVTEFRAAQAELEYRALCDPLTGLANRSLSMDRLTSVLTDSRRPGSVSVAFCDVDHFKHINDTHGHHVGDEVLKEVARRLRGAVRSGDTVARMGGDEFIVLLTDLGALSEAEQVMERAIASLAQPIEIEGEQLQVGLSSGLRSGAAKAPRTPCCATPTQPSTPRSRPVGGPARSTTPRWRVPPATLRTPATSR